VELGASLLLRAIPPNALIPPTGGTVGVGTPSRSEPASAVLASREQADVRASLNEFNHERTE